MTPSRSEEPRKSLTVQVIQKLREDIRKGVYEAGDKLPTELVLVEQFGVSRTVIREAIAELRADGLVRSRHGIGVFVEKAKQPKGGLMLLSQVSERISDILEELELRAAVEIEAAGLAAERASPAQEAEIQRHLFEFSKLMEAGEPTALADFSFHMAIARSTNNSRFEEFLSHLGRRTIPRAKLSELFNGKHSLLYREDQLHAEHQAVADAILSKDTSAAREAMRTHLVGSLERYRTLARQGVQVSDVDMLREIE